MKKAFEDAPSIHLERFKNERTAKNMTHYFLSFFKNRTE